MSDNSGSKDNNQPVAAVEAYQQATLAIRSGYQRTHEAEHSEAMFLTSSYVFENAELAARHFSNEIQGNVYSRYTNPTVRAFEQRLAAMEGGEQAVGTSSGEPDVGNSRSRGPGSAVEKGGRAICCGQLLLYTGAAKTSRVGC